MWLKFDTARTTLEQDLSLPSSEPQRSLIFACGCTTITGCAKGHKRTLINPLIKVIKRKPDADVRSVDEFGTIRLCSTHHNDFLSLANRKHRYTVCQNRRCSWNRDIDAGNSITLQRLRDSIDSSQLLEDFAKEKFFNS